MFDFYQRRKLKNLFTKPLTRMVLFVLAVAMCYSAFTRYEKAVAVKEHRSEAEAEVEALKEHKQMLEERVRYLSDDRGIEAEMRRQYDVALPGEQVVVIVEPEVDERNASITPYKGEAEPAWYQFWR